MISLKDILLNSGKKYPTITALISPNGTIVNYADMIGRWRQIADTVKLTNERIGILCDNKLHGISALGGILLADCTYVPLNTKWPDARIKDVISDCTLSGIVISRSLVDRIDQSWIISQTEIGRDLLFIQLEIGALPKENPLPDLAYILYTSGSTGRPNGVMITHDNALSFIQWCTEEFDLKQDDIVCSVAGLHFDLSVFDLFASFYNGCTILLLEETLLKVPKKAAKYISENGATVIYATPTFYRILLDLGRLDVHDYHHLRLCLYAGEEFPKNDLVRLMSMFDDATFYNLYGPTETNVCTFFKLPRNIDGLTRIPIGWSCSHVSCRIEGDQDTGELWVSGASVSPGYWNNEVLTKSKNVYQNGQLWYKTGDIVQKDEQGNLIFKGRNDRMVKRRGHRIELDEIEMICLSCPDVKKAAIVCDKGQEIGDPRIICYYELGGSQDGEDAQRIRAFLIAKIPIYMMPDVFLPIGEIPMTSTMKTDYQRLKEMSKG